MANCTKTSEESSEPRTRPRPLLLRKLPACVVVKDIAAANEVRELQPSSAGEKYAVLGL